MADYAFSSCSSFWVSSRSMLIPASDRLRVFVKSVPISRGQPPLLSGVRDIFFLSSKEKMLDVHTWGVVAVVQAVYASLDSSVLNFPGNAVSAG